MVKPVRIIKLFIFILFVALVSGCAPQKKNTYYQKRKKAAHINTEQLGRNRYFFSPKYQKKLSTTYRKKR